MNGLEEQINRVLNDPAQLEQITRLARSFMGTETAPSPPSPTLPDAETLSRLRSLMSDPGGQERALIEAMKPYLSEKRRRKLDKAMRIAHIAGLAGRALGEGSGENDPSL